MRRLRSRIFVEILEAIKTRRSIAKLGGEVGEDEVRTIVEAALWAPNHKLTRPWTFTVLRGEARARLGVTWAALAAEACALEGSDREAFVEREARKPLRAPVILVASTRTADDPVIATEDFAATAAAVQNALLAAHALGLGAIWRTGPMTYRAEIKEHLGLDPTDRIVGFVYIGRPAMEVPKNLPRDVGAVMRVVM